MFLKLLIPAFVARTVQAEQVPGAHPADGRGESEAAYPVSAGEEGKSHACRDRSGYADELTDKQLWRHWVHSTRHSGHSRLEKSGGSRRHARLVVDACELVVGATP